MKRSFYVFKQTCNGNVRHVTVYSYVEIKWNMQLRISCYLVMISTPNKLLLWRYDSNRCPYSYIASKCIEENGPCYACSRQSSPTIGRHAILRKTLVTVFPVCKRVTYECACGNSEIVDDFVCLCFITRGTHSIASFPNRHFLVASFILCVCVCVCLYAVEQTKFSATRYFFLSTIPSIHPHTTTQKHNCVHVRVWVCCNVSASLIVEVLRLEEYTHTAA